MCLDNKNKGAMAEWSKAVDLSSIIFGCAGSNPAGTILGHHTATINEFPLSGAVQLYSRVRIPPHPSKGV